MRAGLIYALVCLASAGFIFWIDRQGGGGEVELLNVSYDPTRELWRDINQHFREKCREEDHVEVTIKQSHDGSSTQAAKVVHGLDADVVSLALWSDVEMLHKAGLVHDGWEKGIDGRSVAYYSTIVFVVRKNNPKRIHDWPDLIREGVEVITPNPKTSGNGRLSFLAAWGAKYLEHHSEDEARAFVAELYRHVPVLDTGARGASHTFAHNTGDVHLTWENEAYLEKREHPGELEIVYPQNLAYPKRSIRAEPPVAMVDAYVDRKGTRNLAEKYLKYLWTDEAQEIIARHHYRPVQAEILAAHRDEFPSVELFTISEIAGSWAEAEKKFFGRHGVYDSIQRRR